MADTVRSRSDLLTLLADNTTGAVSPQDMRDVLVSLHGVYGEIYVEDGASAQTFGTTPVKVTAWAANGNSSGTTPDHTNDYITVGSTGIYVVRFCAAIINGANGSTFKFYIRVGTTEQPGGTYVKPANNDVVNVSTSRILSLTASDTVCIYGEADTDSKAATITDATLIVHRIA